MPVESDLLDGLLVIRVVGTLDSKIQKPFREAYQKEGISEAVLDLHLTEFIDSSGISLLLGLHTSLTRKLSAPIQIKNASAGIKEIIQISRLDKFFNII